MIDETKIMQYADGTLPEEEKEAVEKAIESNSELKKLFKDYQETADILFNLGQSIKSQPLPNSLKEKLKIINKWKEKSQTTKKLFIFFKIPKIQYAAVAAALALFFYGGFHTNEVLMVKKIDNSSNLQALAKKDEKFMTLSSKSSEMSKENLSERIINFYRYFDEIKFTNEINAVIDNIEENEEFELSLKDVNGKIIKFINLLAFSTFFSAT